MGTACEILTNKKRLLSTTNVQQKVFPFFTELSTLSFPIVRGDFLNSIFSQIYQLIQVY